MANLIKRGARSARVKDGYTYTGCDYDMVSPIELDGFPPILYGLTIGKGGSAQFKAEEHKLELTEQEMLETIAEWMKLFARNQLERRKARVKA